MSDDLEYFRRRESEERRASMSCENASVRAAHLSFAEQYSALVHLLRTSAAAASAAERELEQLLGRE